MNRHSHFGFTNRKSLYAVLICLLVIVLTMSIAYAAMSVTLKIVGNSEVVASNWDIHFDNVVVDGGSSTKEVPSINGNSISFSTTLNKPGDFYKFTVDVVNDGMIDAIIASVDKNSSFSEEQQKVLNFEVEYVTGDPITSNYILRKGTSTAISVKLEYKKDISSADLLSTSTEINASFSVLYAQYYDDNSENDNDLGSDSVVDNVATIVAVNRTYTVAPGDTLYNVINQKYDELNTSDNEYPRASTYTVYTSATEHIILDDDGNALDLKTTVVESGKTYTSVGFFKTLSVSDDDVQNGIFNISYINYSEISDISSFFDDSESNSSFSLTAKQIVLLFDSNETYFDIFIFSYFHTFSGVQSEELTNNLIYDTLNNYVLSFPAGQNVGCGGTTSSSLFGVFIDENKRFIEFERLMTHGDNVTFKYIKPSGNYDSTKLQVAQAFEEYFNGGV